MKFNQIILMAGLGQRFHEKGFQIPKPYLIVENKPMFIRAAESLADSTNEAEVTAIILKKHLELFDTSRKSFSTKIDFNVTQLLTLTKGPAETAYLAIKKIRNNSPIIITDCDHEFSSQTFNHWLENYDKIDADVACLTFESKKSHFSFIEFRDHKAIGIREKEQISNIAIAGVYFFRNKEIFEELFKEYIQLSKAELFISQLLNMAIKRNLKFAYFKTEYLKVYGTPEELLNNVTYTS